MDSGQQGQDGAFRLVPLEVLSPPLFNSTCPHISEAADNKTLYFQINCLIASYIGEDRNVAAFAAACHSTHAAVYCHRAQVWRTLFRESFSLPPDISNNVLRQVYTRRRRTMRRGASFAHGQNGREKECLIVLRDIIISKLRGILSIAKQSV